MCQKLQAAGNDQTRMTNDEGTPNDTALGGARQGSFVIRHWGFVRHSSFVIRHFIVPGLLSSIFYLLSSFHTHAQFSAPKISKIEIKHRGPQAVSDELIRANIRIKPGDSYLPTAIDEDVRNLYSTGLFYDIQVHRDAAPDGTMVLIYEVQGKPRLVDIKFQGNKKFSDSKLHKKITSKINSPLDEQKLFTDSQEILKMYQKSGYPHTQVKYVLNIDTAAGRGIATFEITESPKIKLVDVHFMGAKAFTQRKLRKQIKTRRHWMFSWITSSGVLKDEQFEEDQEKLKEFYRDHGYIDFEIQSIEFVNPTPRTLIIRFHVYEGAQYKVGSVKFVGNKIFSDADLARGMRTLHSLKGTKGKLGHHGLPMDVGDNFTPKVFTSDIEAVEDFYGSKGYIDVSTSTRNLIVLRIPNTEAGTMDLEFRIEEGQKSYVEKIEIRGNTKTKDKVIRRELAVSPGEVFDMVRVKVSKERLEQLQFFEPGKVEARPQPTDIPNRKDLVIGVDEKNTGNLSLGAGFSSVDSIVGFAEVSQGNFDLFHPPTFTGAGQKFRLRVQIGTQRQDYIISFQEPWFLGRRLKLDVELYYRDLNFQSPGDIYHETHAGARFGISRALRPNVIGGLTYTIEDLGIFLNPGYHGYEQLGIMNQGSGGSPGNQGSPQIFNPNVPNDIINETGHHLLSQVGGSLAYDTRNSALLPNRGQRTELYGAFVGGPLGGDKEYYKLELRTAWYFKGFLPGHVLEILGRGGVAESLEHQDVPFYDRYYLGGLTSLRGFKYRDISPRQTNPPFEEPIGGDTLWFGSAEYSIPIIDRLRFAAFYDVGAVAARSYHFGDLSNFNDNWGLGLRLNLPIGPLRLDYGIPITNDK